MLGNLKNLWSGARGCVLLDEIIKIQNIYEESDENTKSFMFATIAHNMIQINENFGRLKDLRESDKNKLSKFFLREAIKASPSNVGLGLGLRILSIFIESQHLPGEKALEAYRECEHFVMTSLVPLEQSAREKLGFRI